MTGITLDLSGAQLSDLFFNYEHPHRDQLFRDYESSENSPTQDELLAAAFRDAVDFVECYQIPVRPMELATDFEGRV